MLFLCSLASSLICPGGHPSRLELTSGRCPPGQVGRERQSKVLTGCRINIGFLLNYRTLHHSQRRCVHGAEKDTEQT